MSMRALAMANEADPRSEFLLASEPFLDGLEPLGSQVLVAIYVRPQKTASGIYLTDKLRDEDIYQGKVGLVLKMGPLAFLEDETHKFGDRVPEKGEWVIFRIGDTFPFIMGDNHYRFVEDVAIRAIIDRPDVVL